MNNATPEQIAASDKMAEECAIHQLTEAISSPEFRDWYLNQYIPSRRRAHEALRGVQATPPAQSQADLPARPTVSPPAEMPTLTSLPKNDWRINAVREMDRRDQG